MPFMRRRPLLRAAAVGGVAYMGAKAGTNKAMQQEGAQQGGKFVGEGGLPGLAFRHRLQPARADDPVYQKQQPARGDGIMGKQVHVESAINLADSRGKTRNGETSNFKIQ